MTDYAIPLVWPNYPIKIAGHSFLELGHAGVIIVNGETGYTRYFEFGRYRDSAGLTHYEGLARSSPIPNIGLSGDGLNSLQFYNAVLSVNQEAAKGLPSFGTIFELPDGGYERALAFAESVVANSLEAYGVYDVAADRTCYGFAKEVVRVGGVDFDGLDGWFIFDNVPADAMSALIDARGGFLIGASGKEYLTGKSAEILHREEFEDGKNFNGKEYDGALKQKYCFAAGTLIDMWDGTTKPIEEVRAVDEVVSFDERGDKVKGIVRRTFVNNAERILDFHGTGVTPGHVYLCGDGPYKGQWRRIFDILCDDGTIVDADGHSRRAATLARVGSPEDAMVRVLTVRGSANVDQDGTATVTGNGMIRAGTLLLTDDGRTVSLLQVISDMGLILDPNAVAPGIGELRRQPGGPVMPYLILDADFLPKPEDYVLARSGLTKDEMLAGPDLHDGRALTVTSASEIPAASAAGWQSWAPGECGNDFDIGEGYTPELATSSHQGQSFDIDASHSDEVAGRSTGEEHRSPYGNLKRPKVH